MEFFTTEKWVNWVDVLADQDYLVIDDFISESLFQKLKSFLIDHLDHNNFSEAGIGALAEYQVKKSIRGDFVYWLDKKRDVEVSELFYLIEHMNLMLNKLCYLSLSGYEFHLAHYPKGSYYKRHLDQFRERNNRMITVIMYLNGDWQKGDGGELKVYRNEKDPVIVDPIAKRCVIFKSDTLEHEVLITNKSRYSLTGWLLYQPTSVGYLLG